MTENTLENLCSTALAKPPYRSAYADRVNKELGIISQRHCQNTFLAAYEIMNFLKSKQFLSTPGRGAGCNTLTAYLLGITEIDPVNFDLPCERFWGTVNPPICIDLSSEDLPEVITFLKAKYRKMVVTPADTVWSNNEVSEELDINIDFCDGLPPAHIVIQGLYELTRISRLLQMTCLTASMFKDIPLDDQATYSNLRRHVFGVNTIPEATFMAWQIKNLDDLALISAVMRPGLIEYANLIARCRRGDETLPAIPSLLQPLLCDTCNIFIYQAQLFQALHDIANLDYFEANAIRKAICKRKEKEIAEYAVRFLDGCRQQKLQHTTAIAIWNKIADEAALTYQRGHANHICHFQLSHSLSGNVFSAGI